MKQASLQTCPEPVHSSASRVLRMEPAAKVEIAGTDCSAFNAGPVLNEDDSFWHAMQNAQGKHGPFPSSPFEPQ